MLSCYRVSSVDLQGKTSINQRLID